MIMLCTSSNLENFFLKNAPAPGEKESKTCYHTYFFNQTPRLLFFSLFVLVRLLFKDSYYLRVAFILLGSWWIAMMTEIGTCGRYRYVCLIEAGSSMHSLSVLLSAMETSHRTQTGLEIDSSVSVGGNY